MCLVLGGVGRFLAEVSYGAAISACRYERNGFKPTHDKRLCALSQVCIEVAMGAAPSSFLSLQREKPVWALCDFMGHHAASGAFQ